MCLYVYIVRKKERVIAYNVTLGIIISIIFRIKYGSVLFIPEKCNEIHYI